MDRYMRIGHGFLLSLLGLFFLIVPSLHAAPEDVVRDLVRRAKKNPYEYSDRVLSEMLAHPTEKVFLAAAAWPPDVKEGQKIYDYLKPFVPKIPKLREYIKGYLFLGNAQQKEWAVSMLSGCLNQDSELHEGARRWARKGSRAAILALEPFVATDETDRNLLLKEGPHNIWAREVLARHIRGHRDIEQFILKNVEEGKVGLSKSEAAALGVQLRADPKFAEKVRSSLMKYSGTFVFVQNYDLLSVAVQHNIAGVGPLLNEFLDALIYRTASRDNDAFAKLPEFLEMYLSVAVRSGEVDVGRLSKLIEALPEYSKLTALSKILVYAPFLPSKAEPLIRKARSLVPNDRRVCVDTPEIRKMLAQVVEHFTSSDTLNLGLVNGLSEFPDRKFAMDQLRKLSLNPDAAVRNIAQAWLFRMDPFLPDFAKGPPAVVVRQAEAFNQMSSQPLRRSSFHRLIASPSPPVGWRQVVQEFSLNFTPYSTPCFIDADSLTLGKRGDDLRNRSLGTASKELKAGGFSLFPAQWLLSQFESRNKKSNKPRETKLRPNEESTIQSNVASSMRDTYKITNDDLSQPPYRTYYQDAVNRQLWLAQLADRRREDSNEKVSEAWRQNMLEELHGKFRNGLKVILKNNLGKLSLTAEGKSRRYLTGGDISDLEIGTDGFSTVFWRGRPYRIEYQGTSFEGIVEGSSTPATAFPREIAALTLGSRNRNLSDVSKEVYLSRFFDEWVLGYQSALSSAKNASLDRIGARLKMTAWQEVQKWKKREHMTERERIFLGRMWSGLEQNVNYWRDRESAAVSRGDYSFQVTPQNEVEFPEHATGDVPRAEVNHSVYRGLSERGLSHNKDVTEKEKKTAVFRIIPDKKKENSLPRRFLVGYEDHFSDPHDLKTWDGISASRESADFFIHTESVCSPSLDGYVSLATPTDSTKFFRLDSLQVYSGSGQKLSSNEYTVVENKRNGLLAIKLKGHRDEHIRFFAGFSEAGEIPPTSLPTIDRNRLGAIIPELEEAGFTKFSADLRTRLMAGDKRKPLSLVEVSNLFRSSGVYATSNDKSLAGNLPPIEKGNPFQSFSRFLDPRGVMYAQCDGANDFFAELLKRVIDPASGIEIDTQDTFERDPGSLMLSEASAHRIILFRIPGHSFPLQLDVTFSQKNSLLQKALHVLRPKPPPKPEMAHPEKGLVPAWVQENEPNINDEPNKENETETERESRASAESRIAVENIESARAALHASVLDLIKKGIWQKENANDPTDPFRRSQELSVIAQRILNNEGTPESWRSDLRKLHQWSFSSNLESRSDFLNAIAKFAKRSRLQQEKFLKQRRATYPDLSKVGSAVELLFRRIEAIGVSDDHPVGCETVLKAL